MLVFGITAGLAGFIGGLSAYYYQFIAPGTYSLDLSIFVVSIIVLGGIGNLTGTIVGAIILGVCAPSCRTSISSATKIAIPGRRSSTVWR